MGVQSQECSANVGVNGKLYSHSGRQKGESIWTLSLVSIQFFYNPKISLNIKLISFLKEESKTIIETKIT